MTDKIFTCVTKKANRDAADSLCYKLPIILKYLSSVEELFPLLSDPHYHTDFIVIESQYFENGKENLDMFDIIHTLSILIKSTVHRAMVSERPQKRDTKIIVVVDDNVDPKTVKEIIQYTEVASVGWILNNPSDYQSVENYMKNLISGDFTNHPKVSEMIKPKKKSLPIKNTIELTVRQSQVLHLVQDRGASNKTIAKILGITESTVKLHVGSILKKYGVKNRTQLAVFAKTS